MLVFGLARTYTQAVCGRLLSGILCGNLGVLKTFLTEITDTTNRGGGFAVLSISWSIGEFTALQASRGYCSILLVSCILRSGAIRSSGILL